MDPFYVSFQLISYILKKKVPIYFCWRMLQRCFAAKLAFHRHESEKIITELSFLGQLIL